MWLIGYIKIYERFIALFIFVKISGFFAKPGKKNINSQHKPTQFNSLANRKTK